MGRWEPDARGRLARVALELYAERGYEQTTVGDIAERAGVTERTYFRHFADKREALFDGSAMLQTQLVDAIRDAPADLTPIEVVGDAFASAATLLEDRGEHARTRAGVIAANPSLQERELYKMATLASAASGALTGRGVPEPTAALAAAAGVAAFTAAFEAWVADPSSTNLPAAVRDKLDALRAVTQG
ncbi:TetR/AcrR family transcriptional regulator [Cellulomonas sp. McL0617]|uniref:TetR/AcrR family transcriptional regulator n=1 Tax=Cellulomonas sp. McL0617 TaxID=3415675 RepID=UPI003CF128B1